MRWHPWFIADSIAIANPPEFPDDRHLATIERLAIRLHPWAWFRGGLSLLDIQIDKPIGELRLGPSGMPTYSFDRLPAEDDATSGALTAAIACWNRPIHDGYWTYYE